MTNATLNIADGSMQKIKLTGISSSNLNIQNGSIQASTITLNTGSINVEDGNITGSNLSITAGTINANNANITSSSITLTNSMLNMQDGNITTFNITDWQSENSNVKIDVDLNNGGNEGAVSDKIEITNSVTGQLTISGVSIIAEPATNKKGTLDIFYSSDPDFNFEDISLTFDKIETLESDGKTRYYFTRLNPELKNNQIYYMYYNLKTAINSGFINNYTFVGDEEYSEDIGGINTDGVIGATVSEFSINGAGYNLKGNDDNNGITIANDKTLNIENLSFTNFKDYDIENNGTLNLIGNIILQKGSIAGNGNLNLNNSTLSISNNLINSLGSLNSFDSNNSTLVVDAKLKESEGESDYFTIVGTGVAEGTVSIGLNLLEDYTGASGIITLFQGGDLNNLTINGDGTLLVYGGNKVDFTQLEEDRGKMSYALGSTSIDLPAAIQATESLYKYYYFTGHETYSTNQPGLPSSLDFSPLGVMTMGNLLVDGQGKNLALNGNNENGSTYGVIVQNNSELNFKNINITGSLSAGNGINGVNGINGTNGTSTYLTGGNGGAGSNGTDGTMGETAVFFSIEEGELGLLADTKMNDIFVVGGAGGAGGAGGKGGNGGDGWPYWWQPQKGGKGGMVEMEEQEEKAETLFL